MTTLKEGDLINVVKDHMKKGSSVDTILISIPPAGEGLGRGRNRKIYKIEHNEFHSSLSKLGVNVGHYTLKAIQVESVHYPPERPDVIVVNGEFELPDPETSTPMKRNILDSYFDDEQQATSIAVQLNEGELDKLVELRELVDKALTNMEDVVKNKRV